jgi:hypothetical protein
MPRPIAPPRLVTEALDIMTILLLGVVFGIAAYEASMFRLKRRHELVWRNLGSPEPIWIRGAQAPSPLYFQFVLYAEFMKLGDVALTSLCLAAYVAWVALIIGLAYGFAQF